MAENLHEQGYYDTGTATVASGGTVVTGQGTAWSQIVKPSDDFGKHVGLPIPIASVDSDTQITLAYPWPGANQTAQPYRISFTPYHVSYRQALMQIGQLLQSGNVSALAALESVPDRMPYFDGAGSMDLADFGESGRALMGLNGANGKFPVWTGAGTAEARDIVGTVAESGGVPIGALSEAGSDGGGHWVRRADGVQIYQQERVASYYAPAGGSELRNTWNWAKSFSAPPIVTANMTGTGNATPTSGMISWVGPFAIGESSCNVSVFRIAGMTNFEPGDTINLQCTARGRWFEAS